MSHFSKIRTEIRDLDYLKQALDDLHFRYDTGHVHIRGYRGSTADVELAVRTNSEYDIGFYLDGENYQMIADWWGVETDTDIRQQDFANQVAQRYAYHKTVNELESRGFYVAEEEANEENVIELTVRWF